MSFDAIEKYNTRLLIPKETGMFNRCSPFKWTPKGRHQRACAEGKPADQLCIVSRSSAPFSFVKYVFDCVHVVSFLACVAGVRNFKNLLLINQKIYVHSWVFVCYQYRGIIIVL